MAASLGNTTTTTIKRRIVESVEIPVLTRCCFCFPLRKGLITFAYANLVLTAVVSCVVSIFIARLRAPDVDPSEADELPRLAIDDAGLLFELVMTVVFIVALHKKHAFLMRVYMWVEVVFSLVGFVYSLAFVTSESAGELFLVLLQLMIQVYLVILVWSSIVKMERDGSVKYVRDQQPV